MHRFRLQGKRDLNKEKLQRQWTAQARACCYYNRLMDKNWRPNRMVKIAIPGRVSACLQRNASREWRTDQKAQRNARLRAQAHSHVGIMRGMVLGFAFAGTFGLAITLTFAKALVFASALWLRA